MNPATRPPTRRDALRLLVADRSGEMTEVAELHQLPAFLEPGDLLVLNDAATLPASLSASFCEHTTTSDRRDFEIRLTGAEVRDGVFWCVLFGAGNWSMPTEERGPAPILVVGQVVWLGALDGERCPAKVTAVDSISPRLVELTFLDRGARLWEFLYTQGRPIQYAYLDGRYGLNAFQTAYAARPWAAEMPSAGRGLSWELLQRLAAAGIKIATLTHSAGLSSTGDPVLDARLPLPERYEIPDSTVEAIADARARGSRVIAVGTTVVRALEGAARQGSLHSGDGVTDFKLGPETQLQVVDSLLTGMHGPGESHFELLGAFAERTRLLAVWQRAAAHGFACHEFGDLCLILKVPTFRHIA